jgi:hypothetical protein
MKWASMYLVGFIVFVGGLLAALWKLGILDEIGTTWAVIGVVIAIGFGIMIAVSHSGTKENIEIDSKGRSEQVAPSVVKSHPHCKAGNRWTR